MVPPVTHAEIPMQGATLCVVVLLGARAALAAPAPVFDVRAHGATGRKSDKATAAIQRAIDAAAAAGGGTVHFPAGDYLSGTIRLRSHVVLHLEAGATVWASRDPADYPGLAEPGRGPAALVVAEGVRHIGLRGAGRIHGQAQHVYREAGGVDPFIAEETENARRAGVEMKRWHHVPPVVRGVYIHGATDVTIEGISILEAQAWLLHVAASERVFIRGVRLASSLEAGVNADGIDIDGCRNVVISDVVVETGDDAIVLKSTRQGGEARPTENVTVTNCVVTSTSAGLKIGTETHGDFRHIRFDNCVVRDTNRGLAIIVRDGATVEDVTFSNISLETNRKHWNWWGNGEALWLAVLPRTAGSKVGRIRDVVLENITARGQGTSRIQGFAAGDRVQALENIQLRGVRLVVEPEGKPDKRASHALAARHVAGLVLRDLEVRWSEARAEPGWGSALSLADVRDLHLRGFLGRQGDPRGQAPTIRLENVTDALLRDVEALPGAGTLLELAGPRTRNVHLEGVDLLGRARTRVQRPASMARRAPRE